MKNIILNWVIISTVMFLTSCKDKGAIKDSISVKGKTVKSINQYKISFQDGTVFDMSEKSAKKIYYLIRHAEKDTLPSPDPALTEEGTKRSYRLAEIFDNTQLDAIYSTMTMRTLYTVDSLADAKGMVTMPYDAKTFKETGKQLRSSLNTHRALIVGHSNTTPVLANYLSDSQYFTSTFDESEYDHLVVVIERLDSTKQLLDLKY